MECPGPDDAGAQVEQAAGLPGEAGATLRELMDRMGHASTRAALIYQHRTTHRDKLIADEISKRAQAALKPSGTQRARGKKRRT